MRPTQTFFDTLLRKYFSHRRFSTGEFCDSICCPVKRGLIVLAVEIVAKSLMLGQNPGLKVSPLSGSRGYQSLSGEAQDVDVLGNQFPSICVITHNLDSRRNPYVSDCRFLQLKMANFVLSLELQRGDVLPCLSCRDMQQAATTVIALSPRAT